MSTSDLHPNLVVSPSTKAHKLLFSKMRDAATSSEDFVKYSKRSMRILAEDAIAEFPSTDVTITTPCGYVLFFVTDYGSLFDTIVMINYLTLRVDADFFDFLLIDSVILRKYLRLRLTCQTLRGTCRPRSHEDLRRLDRPKWGRPPGSRTGC